MNNNTNTTNSTSTDDADAQNTSSDHMNTFRCASCRSLKRETYREPRRPALPRAELL